MMIGMAIAARPNKKAGNKNCMRVKVLVLDECAMTVR
jgi:hypothetical protein